MQEIKLSNDLNKIEFEINYHKQIAGQSIWEIGRRLNHVKENDLVHGQFTKWLEKIDISHFVANQFMKVAKQLPNNGMSNNLGINALYLIATLPEEERTKEHVTSKGETKTVDEMTVRELQEVKRQLNQKDAQLEQQLQEIERLKNKPPEVIHKPYIPDDIQQIEKSEKELRNKNRKLEEERQSLQKKLYKYESDTEEVERLKKNIEQLNKKKKQINQVLDANERLTELEHDFNSFFDDNMAPLKYKPLVDDLYLFNGAERVGKLINLAMAWADDMERIIPRENRKIIEGEIIND